MIRTVIVLAATALLGACAAPITRTAAGSSDAVDKEARFQRELALQQHADDSLRAARVYQRLRVAAADICGKDTTGLVGVMVASASNDANGQTLQRVLGVGAQPTVWAVIDGSPAQRAGIAKGDVVLAVAGNSMVDSNRARETLAGIAPGETVPITIRRAGQDQQVALSPELGCRYPLSITQQQIINAFADGEKIAITQGMVSFARTDDELALVIAHEMAHNLMKHIEAKKQNAAGGFLADLALAVLTRGAYKDASFTNAAAQAYSQEFEAEADYVGLYIMAKAGLPIDEAPKFWRRMAIAHPANIKTNHSASHPSTASRMVALEATVAEIKAKIAAGQPLEPNVKEGKFAPPAGQ